MELFTLISKHNENIITPIRVTTMTIVAKIVSPINIQQFYCDNKLNQKNIDGDLYIENKEIKCNKKGQLIKSFRNQITFKSQTRRCNIKLFTNGLQMTGIKSYDDIEHFTKEISKRIEREISDIKMVMINILFKFRDSRLHLYDLYDKFEDSYLETHYTPEIYPGLKLKMNSATALIFATGSVIVSSKTVEDSVELIEFLLMNVK
jgi:TATA-box binding protein (TBP) (component of TFIID and TFIIIB)